MPDLAKLRRQAASDGPLVSARGRRSGQPIELTAAERRLGRR